MEFEKYKDNGLTGLANLGNTCFINSTLQCLSHTYELNEFLDKKTYENKLNKKCDSVLLVEWDKLRTLMWSKNCIISPKGFISCIQKVAHIKDKDIFTGYAQNDLPEFMLFLVDCFHNAINREVNMKISGNAINDLDKLAKKCYKMIEDMYKKDYSEIVQLFYGIHVSEIVDINTKEILSQKPEPFFMINLPIPQSSKHPSIYDCFDLYTSSERMDGDNKWYNEDKDEKVDIDRHIRFFSLPDILIIDFKRFTASLRKNQILIDFPIKNLDLSDYIVGYNKESYKYDLYGICNHSGSVMGGHYTSFVKNANGSWYHFNDTHITEIKDENKIITPQAYCLFYRKVKIV